MAIWKQLCPNQHVLPVGYVGVCLPVCDSAVCVAVGDAQDAVSGLCTAPRILWSVQMKTGEPMTPAALNKSTLATTQRHKKYPFFSSVIWFLCHVSVLLDSDRDTSGPIWGLSTDSSRVMA